MIYIIVSLVWWIVGVASFVYWWTKNYDFRAEDSVIAILVGFFGPVAFIVGWAMDGNSKKIIIKRRES